MADGGGPSRKRARAEGSSDEDAARRPPNEGEPITSTSEPAEDGSDQQPDAPPELRGATRFAMVRRLGGRVHTYLHPQSGRTAQQFAVWHCVHPLYPLWDSRAGRRFQQRCVELAQAEALWLAPWRL